MVLDMLDKRLIYELHHDCRLTYSALARHFGLTVKAIKKRVDKLIEMGVIHCFYIGLNPGLWSGMVQPHLALTQIWTDGSEEEDLFFEELGALSSLMTIWKSTRNIYVGRALVFGFEGLTELVQFLEGFDVITKVIPEVVTYVPISTRQPALTTPKPCYEFKFTKNHLQVLRVLKDDPRMSVAEIAHRTRLTPKRVRKMLSTFKETQCVKFETRIDWSAAGQAGALIRTHLEDPEMSHEDFGIWLHEEYPYEYMWTSYVADNPSTNITMITAYDIHVINKMTKTISSAPFTKNADALVLYRGKRLGHHGVYYLNKMLSEAGL